MLKRWLALLTNFTGLLFIWLVFWNYHLSLYLFRQAKGQLHILTHTESIEDYKKNHILTTKENSNIQWIQQIKQYAEDSLGFTKTQNYQRLYFQNQQPILWAVTASCADSLSPYLWEFPVIGSVSYKGFFDFALAEQEAATLEKLNYDVEIRPVSAWSTLGWTKDPILSNMLSLSKGALCNLIFHELFHSTYYAKGEVDYNENLATFIGHQATLLFLKPDSIALTEYLHRKHDQEIFHDYILNAAHELRTFYHSPHSIYQKTEKLMQIVNGIDSLNFFDKNRFQSEKTEILKAKNAYFIGFNQYYRYQDSLETIFNKIYRGDLRNMVLDLKVKSMK